jgi:cobalt-zinc-cadmium efflux system protein
VWVDAALSLVIALWISHVGFKELPSVINLLMQGAPSHLALSEVEATMCSIDGVVNVHHIHLWQLDDHISAMEAHVVLSDITAMDQIRKDLRAILQDRHQIFHATFEFESEATICEHNITHHPHDVEILQHPQPKYHI